MLTQKDINEALYYGVSDKTIRRMLDENNIS